MIKIKHLLLLVLCCSLGTTSLFAQKSARISGNVYSDSEGPLMMVNVTERDKNDRIIEAAITDMEGNFSMVVKNTSNRLEISYIGYKTQKIEIGSRTVFNVKMVEDNVLEDVVVVAKQVSRNGALDILDREVTQATQKFSMSDMEGLSFTTVDEALQGQIAGLDVVFSSGNLGSGTQMRLRGTASLDMTNADPLIVVNDVEFSIPAGETLDKDNLNEEQFSSLLSVNPEDIESIEVLKDAASCAAWGAKGANGVIKIKTKRGKRGPTRVNFRYTFKDSWMAEGLNLLNGDDYTMLLKESHFNPTQNPASADIPELNYNADELYDWQNFNENTDWVDKVTQHGYRNDFSLNLSGGGEKATFRISGTYANQTGTSIKQQLDQYTSRLSLDYYVSDRIKVMAEFSFSYSDNQQNYSSYGDLLGIAQNIMPNMSVYHQGQDGINTSDYYKMSSSASEELSDQKNMRNPVALAHLAKKNEEHYSINPQIMLEYNLLGLEDNETQLKYRGLVNMNASTLSNAAYLPATLSLPSESWSSKNVNVSELYDNKSLQFTTRHNLIFTPYLGNKDHYLTMSGQFEMYTYNSTSQSQKTYGLPNGINSTVAGSELTVASTGKGQSRNVSFGFQAHYSYKSKYTLGLSVRGDGCTKFGKDKKWLIFPSISGRWNISDESWMNWAKPVLSMLSIRPSYGWSGNAPSEDYLMYTNYSMGNGSYLGMTAFVPEAIRLSNLTATDKRELNIGSDFGFFNDFITGSFNYYKSTTSKQLQSGYPIPASSGYETLKYKNTGSLENTGWELNISTTRIKVYKDFSVSAYFNIGQNFNEITSMEKAVLDQRNPEYTSPNDGYYLGRIQVGNPIGSIYGFRYKGVYRYSYKNWEKALSEAEAGRNGTCPIVYDAAGKVVYNADGTPKRMVLFYNNEDGTSTYKFNGGDAIYEDINHDGQINQLDLVYLGNSNPKAQGGFGFTFNYKRFTLKTNFAFRWDVDVVNMARLGVESMRSNNNQSFAVNWRWRKDGDITWIPRALYNAGYNTLGSDRYVEDASYLRFSYLQASYSFEPKWLEKTLGLKTLALSVSADNLAHWSKYTGIDPDISINSSEGVAYDNARTPRSRSYTISLNVGF